MCRSRSVLVIVATFLALVQVTAATAEEKDHTRGGFFVGFGLGGGVATPDSDLDYEGGVMVNFRGGWALADNVTIGLESSLWYRDFESVSVSFSAWTAGATFYPGNMGFFVKGGVGAGFVTSGSGSVVGPGSGFALLTGIGYEQRVTTKFALGIEGNYVYMDVFDRLSGTNFLGANLIFNWYWQ